MKLKIKLLSAVADLKIKRIWVLLGILVILIPITAYTALNSQEDGYRVNRSSYQYVKTDSGIPSNDCRKVTNMSASIDYFVPTRTLAEWTAFSNNKPSSITITDGEYASRTCVGNSAYYVEGCAEAEKTLIENCVYGCNNGYCNILVANLTHTGDTGSFYNNAYFQAATNKINEAFLSGATYWNWDDPSLCWANFWLYLNSNGYWLVNGVNIGQNVIVRMNAGSYQMYTPNNCSIYPSVVTYNSGYTNGTLLLIKKGGT